MARTDASATPDTGLLKLAFRKADVSRLSVVGTDLVLVMKDGSQHVLQDMGLQAMIGLMVFSVGKNVLPIV